MHSAIAEIEDREDGRYYVAHCTFCGWEGTLTPSHKLAAEEAVGHTDTAVLKANYEDAKIQYPNATWEEVFSLEEVED